MSEQRTGQARTVVLHASDKVQDVQRAIDSARRLGEAFEGVRVRIIINGQALDAATGRRPDRLPPETTVGVCAVGLANRGIDAAQLPAGIQVVPAAPIAIAQEQFAGAAYVRL